MRNTTKKAREKYQVLPKEEKISDNMRVNDIRIYLKMKNENQLSREKIK